MSRSRRRSPSSPPTSTPEPSSLSECSCPNPVAHQLRGSCYLRSRVSGSQDSVVILALVTLEAVAAVDRPAGARLEGHHRLTTAVGADGGEERPGTASALHRRARRERCISRSVAFGPTARPAAGAAAWRNELTFLIEGLLARGEDELISTISTDEHSVCSNHNVQHSLPSWRGTLR